MTIKAPYRGKVHGYICNGVFSTTQPKGKRYVGYRQTDNGAVLVYRDPYTMYVVPILLLVVGVASVMFLRHEEVVEYRVSFSQTPVYVDGRLYCTVTNVSDETITVAFTDGEQTSGAIPLFSGESLPYVEIEFVPTHIVYGGAYKFPLEVQNV